MVAAAGTLVSCAQAALDAPGSSGSLEQARQLNQQVEKLYREGKYGAAIASGERALAIRDRLLGPSHRDVAESLNNLAALYSQQGAYDQAERLHLRALAIRDRLRPPARSAIGESLNNLATLYWEQGAYAKAEPLYTRALDMFERSHELDDPLVALILTNLAVLYRDEGVYARAESLLVRALTLREARPGRDLLAVAQSLTNLAALYARQGLFSKAEPLYVRALDLFARTIGSAHPDFALSLVSLATLYRDHGAYDRAEPRYVRALDVLERSLGASHPRVADSLTHLATLYRVQGAYAKAEPRYVRALAIREQALGPTHPEIANSLIHLAELYRAQGVAGKAEPLLARAAEIREQQLRIELVRLPEPRKRAVLALLQGETDGVIAFHAEVMPDSAPALELAVTTVLRRKGRILDSLTDSEASLRRHVTPELRDLLGRRARARSALVAQLYARAGTPTAADVAAAGAARARIDELEAALSARSAEFDARLAPVTFAKVQAAVPAGAVLVEFVDYQRADARAPRRAQARRYLAYLVFAHGAPQWVALGDAAPIDAALAVALAALHGKASPTITRAALRRLDAGVLAPIRARISGISHLILAPDGALNLVPFEALVDSRGHHAVEHYLMSYVTTGRDLLRLSASPRPRAPAVIMVAPAYGDVPPGPPSVAFGALRGAEAEAADLQTYFGTTPLIGASASKAALAALTGPAMLHVATHGFYARDVDVRSVQAGGRSAARGDAPRGLFVEGGSSPPRLAPATGDLADALDRSGLAMAGANRGADGIVTAREIAGFDWWGTQLVVLSACETGVGATPSGDGVYGLRRALVLAGAASHVVSLWNVDDSATRLLMRDFYANLARGAGRAEALRQAKLRFLRQPRLEHPYYWAAFIAAGDWRPLGPGTIARGRHGAR